MMSLNSKELEESKEITRRAFLKIISGLGLTGLMAGGLSGCVPKQTGEITPPLLAKSKMWPENVVGRIPIDPDNPSIVRYDEKCILCGQCIQACQETQSVYGFYNLPVVDETICINCGQCTLVCPTGAISERDDTRKVLKALADPDKFVVVQTAPATRVALGEEFGMPAGAWVMGQQVAALRRLGFDAVLDTNFTADLTIMEEATELIKRIKGEIDKPLPQFTSCSPGWIKFCEYFYPELLPHMSSCKSPQQMFGALAKTYYAKNKNIPPEKFVSVSIMPCTAKKFEAKRPEMNDSGLYLGKPALRDVDIVLTTRELARLLKQRNIDLNKLPKENYDPLMGESTGGAIIFGATGGVMEAAVRTAYFFVTGQQPPASLFNLTPVRGLSGIKEAQVDIPGAGTVKVAICHGMANGRKVLEKVKQGQSPWHFIEFMACPGGCLGGGGQPRTTALPSDEIRTKRLNSLYQADARWQRRESHENPEVVALYHKFLEHPMSELAEKLLHTEYVSRADKLNRTAVAAARSWKLRVVK